MNREYNFLLSGIGTFNKINWNCDTIQVFNLWNWKLYPDIDTNRKYTFNFLGEQCMVNGQHNALAEWNTDRLKLISLLMFGVGQIFLHSVVYSRDLGEENVKRTSSLCLVEDTIRVSPSDALYAPEIYPWGCGEEMSGRGEVPDCGELQSPGRRNTTIRPGLSRQCQVNHLSSS